MSKETNGHDISDVSDRRLNELIDRCAKEQGLTGGSGRFAQYRNFKTKWQTSDKMKGGHRQRSVKMEVTDYLRTASDKVLKEYLDDEIGMCSRNRKNREGRAMGPAPCSETFSAFMDSDIISKRGRMLYLARSYTLDVETEDGPLHHVKEWLDARSMIPERAEDSILAWDDTQRGLWKSTSNIMFRVVEIPARLRKDDPEGPAVKYLMFRQMCLMSTPFDPIGFSHELDAADILDRFPRDLYEDARAELQRLFLWNAGLEI